MVLKITNLHILRYLPTCWLYLLECYTIDNQRCTHTASENDHAELIGYQYITQHAIGSKRRNDPISIILIINTLNTQE